MTFAEFIAGCFWPLVGLFALLLTRIKDKALFRYIATVALVTGFLYFGLWVFYAQSSIVAIVDFYILAGLFGLAGLGFGHDRWGHDKTGARPAELKERLAGIAIMLFGAGMVWMSVSTLFLDFFRPHLVIEGRADNLRVSGRRHVDYLADISGRTVKATTPVYERLKFKPYVRVEVGQGSHYIFKIEYLAN